MKFYCVGCQTIVLAASYDSISEKVLCLECHPDGFHSDGKYKAREIDFYEAEHGDEEAQPKKKQDHNWDREAERGWSKQDINHKPDDQ